MPELFFEIGTEEIPAGYICPALEFMKSRLADFFQKNHIPVSGPFAFATPRRLTVGFEDVVSQQEVVLETFLGQIFKVSFEDHLNPTKSSIVFSIVKWLYV